VAKGNLTRPPASLAFHLEDGPGTSVARLVWDGERPWTATQLLQAHTDTAGAGPARHSVIDEARPWLRETLAAGPRLARELRREASERGIGRSARYAARKAEGIAIAKEHAVQGSWVWTLTRTGDVDGEREDDREREDVAPPGSPEVQHLQHLQHLRHRRL
jgi:hypothetical protein